MYLLFIILVWRLLVSKT